MRFEEGKKIEVSWNIPTTRCCSLEMTKSGKSPSSCDNFNQSLQSWIMMSIFSCSIIVR